MGPCAVTRRVAQASSLWDVECHRLETCATRISHGHLVRPVPRFPGSLLHPAFVPRNTAIATQPANMTRVARPSATNRRTRGMARPSSHVPGSVVTYRSWLLFRRTTPKPRTDRIGDDSTVKPSVDSDRP